MPAPSKPVQLSPFSAALAGALGGCFSTAVVYPLDVAKTRIQALPKGSDKDSLSMMAVLLRVYEKEGVPGLYRGFMATMINTFSMQYAYFFFYSFVRTSYLKRAQSKLKAGQTLGPLSTVTELVLGAIAGALAQIFTIPVSVIATRQQVGRDPLGENGNSGSSSKDSESFTSVAREIIREEGVTGLWLGIGASLVLTVNPAITYGMFERIKNIVLLAKSRAGDTATKLSPGMTFLVGVLSKTLATVVTYPYIMAKVRVQARSADIDQEKEHKAKNLPRPNTYHHTKTHHPGAIDILARVLKKEGIFGWYQGMQAQITKAVLSQGLLFLSKEQFEQWAVAIIVLLYRLRQK